MSETTPKQDTQREANGQFAKGNKGGPGNPHARKMAQVRGWIYEEVPEADMRQIIRKIAQMAKEGDLNAAKVLLTYQAGKPVPCQDPDSLDQHELELAARTAAGVQPAVKSLQTMNPGAALDFIREAGPELYKAHRQELVKELKQPTEEFEFVEDEDRTEEEIERDNFLAAMLEDFERRQADRQRLKRHPDQPRAKDGPGDHRHPSSG